MKRRRRVDSDSALCIELDSIASSSSDGSEFQRRNEFMQRTHSYQQLSITNEPFLEQGVSFSFFFFLLKGNKNTPGRKICPHYDFTVTVMNKIIAGQLRLLYRGIIVMKMEHQEIL